MLDLAASLLSWLQEGRTFAVASVTGVSGSAPRRPGAALAVRDDGTALGSVSGGCVEGAVYELCLEAMAEGRPLARTFGYSDDDAFAVGLTCGGIIDILVWPVTGPAPALRAYLEGIQVGAPVALARTMPGPGVLPAAPLADSGLPAMALPAAALAVWPDRVLGGTGDPALDRAIAAEAVAMLDAGRTGARELGCDRTEVFVETHLAPPRLLIFGAIDFAAALSRIGRFLGYHVTVCDARPVFATAGRFPDAHEVVTDWPHRYLDRVTVDGRTAIAVLTHDAKFDVPLLERALRTQAAYVGAMGSRRTHDDRLARLRAAGLSGEELARLRSPIGLDLGASTPEEVAVAIAAELVATRRGGTGHPLTATTGPIHARAALHY
ncbi:XdhC family protein [Nonomuraea sp. NBC_01738]|uniref:XdhC family protein n=1 Tax=Nonomuraea sp. NBC_01738 TaxID=2976003 RepID=UPI002E139D5C|nr:XdhC family protein [Nonomuraea sp. NBC_01738]